MQTHVYSKKYLLTGLAIFCFSVLFLSLYLHKINTPVLTANAYQTEKIIFQNNTLNVLLADNNEKRMRGLSGRSELPAGVDGMLFVFDKIDRHGIWMKDMLLSIDIFWLDSEYKIIDQRLNVSPDTYPTVFVPSEKSIYVLEIVSESDF